MQNQNKSEIRETFLLRRRTIPASLREAASNTIAQLLLNHPLFIENQHIGCYFAQEDEIDCKPIIHAIWQFNKQCYLPLVSSPSEKKLHFAAYRPGDALHFNRYKISEPKNTLLYPTSSLDIVLMPLVAFDLTGNRLGRGGGYYDRTFAFMREKHRNHPYLLGLAYHWQQIDALPREDWDIPLAGIVTEKAILFF